MEASKLVCADQSEEAGIHAADGPGTVTAQSITAELVAESAGEAWQHVAGASALEPVPADPEFIEDQLDVVSNPANWH